MTAPGKSADLGFSLKLSFSVPGDTNPSVSALVSPMINHLAKVDEKFRSVWSPPLAMVGRTRHDRVLRFNSGKMKLWVSESLSGPKRVLPDAPSSPGVVCVLGRGALAWQVPSATRVCSTAFSSLLPMRSPGGSKPVSSMMPTVQSKRLRFPICSESPSLWLSVQQALSVWLDLFESSPPIGGRVWRQG